MKKGKLVVLEGINGVGKTTTADLVKKSLEALGHSVAHMKYPCYGTPSCVAVVDYLNGAFGELSKIQPLFACSLFSADRLANKPVLETLLCQNDFVLVDRYTYSNVAIQGSIYPHLADKIHEFVYKTEFEVGGAHVPDLVLWLSIDPDIADMALNEREADDSCAHDGGRDIHEQHKDMPLSAHRIYEALAIDGKWTVINCDTPTGDRLPREEVTRRCISAITNLEQSR